MKKKYLILAIILQILLPYLIITVHFLDVYVNFFQIKTIGISGIPVSIVFLREFLFILIVIIVFINSIILLLEVIEN